ncbi:MAG: hypothetical protein ACE5FT_03665 [Candidatus Nanoarchaeia archaeon]
MKCEECDRMFASKEALHQHREAKHVVKKTSLKFNWKRLRSWSIALLLIFLVGYTGVNFLTAKTLPPTTMAGHVEVNPPSHILKEPMSLNVHKHMLEHADGTKEGPGGVIINYDCETYDCEPGLVEKLEAFAATYDVVYVAPLKNMESKIALTKLGRIETLDDYNAEKIESFIGK